MAKEYFYGFLYPDKYGRSKEELRERAIELYLTSKELAQIIPKNEAHIHEEAVDYYESQCINDCET